MSVLQRLSIPEPDTEGKIWGRGGDEAEEETVRFGEKETNFGVLLVEEGDGTAVALFDYQSKWFLRTNP